MNSRLTIGILTIAMMAVPGIAVSQGDTDNSTHTPAGLVAQWDVSQRCVGYER